MTINITKKLRIGFGHTRLSVYHFLGTGGNGASWSLNQYPYNPIRWFREWIDRKIVERLERMLDSDRFWELVNSKVNPDL